MKPCTIVVVVTLAILASSPPPANAQQTAMPVLHGTHWIAITGKPTAATAGAMMYQKGGNAVDAAAATLAATATMWDVLSWGGETQALIWHPEEQRVIGINALGVAPTGATAAYLRELGLDHPPGSGVDAMVSPGTPGGLMTMLAEWGRLSLADVLEPAIEMAGGYPVEADAVRRIRGSMDEMMEWRYTRAVFFPDGEPPEVGEILVQEDLAATLRKLVEAEAEALAAGADRKDAIYAAQARFYEGDIAEEYVRGAREQGSRVNRFQPGKQRFPEILDQWRSGARVLTDQAGPQAMRRYEEDVVEWGMNVQEAAEAANINSFQLRGSFGEHEISPGRILLHDDTPPRVRSTLADMGYALTFDDRTSGPINAIGLDRENGGFQGGSSHHGDDYGIVWE